MSFLSDEELKQLHSLSFESKAKLKESNIVGCFSCTSVFTYDDIDEYVNYGDTALCPCCGIDSVIPLHQFTDSQKQMVLTELNKKYFQSTDDEFIIPITPPEKEFE